VFGEDSGSAVGVGLWLRDRVPVVVDGMLLVVTG
jgi:hypothetical protein